MEWVSKVLDFIYPPRCPICQEIISWNEDYAICTTCQERIPYIEGGRCLKCSKPVYYEENNRCFDCNRKNFYYEKGWALWLYEGAVKESVYAFKYYNKKEYGKIFAKSMALRYKEDILEAGIDVIVPIPMHRKRKRIRGYNQAEVLAKEMSNYLDIPMSNLLTRHKATKPQKTLNDEQRERNLTHAFKINKTQKLFKNILLVDDIYTTGSTIDACAKLLKETYSVKVYFISLCIGRGL